MLGQTVAYFPQNYRELLVWGRAHPNVLLRGKKRDKIKFNNPPV